ncbi:TraX family protein [Halomonas sp. H10-9-1]|uniref:TraX family protein n=1 Tax=Halomonas sp. H10-9-1 TaxID=2950871 RepID=UPI0032DF756A
MAQQVSVASRAVAAMHRPSSTWTGWGQWLALITMTVDHLTRYALPDGWELGWAGSSIGRIAFPLFAAMVAWHGLFNTRNPLRYARRILVIGLVAQLPYMLMPRAADGLIPRVPLGMPRRLWLGWYPGHFAALALWLGFVGGLG